MVLNLYVLTWWGRRRISLRKRLGEEPMNCWEKFCQERLCYVIYHDHLQSLDIYQSTYQDCKLGQEPSMNFISSTLVTNDRAFVVVRVAIAIWSLTLTLNGFEGQKSFYFGSYFPMGEFFYLTDSYYCDFSCVFNNVRQFPKNKNRRGIRESLALFEQSLVLPFQLSGCPSSGGLHFVVDSMARFLSISRYDPPSWNSCVLVDEQRIFSNHFHAG